MPKYRNKFEAKVAKTIPPTYQYEAQRLPYTLTCQYLPDFIDTARKSLIELKGRFPAADRRKMKAIREQYPAWEIKIIFQKADAPIYKGSKTTNAMWCENNNIQWEQA